MNYFIYLFGCTEWDLSSQDLSLQDLSSLTRD